MASIDVSLCFVCLGNICRSPTAEGVMKKLVDDAGLSPRIMIDSAGTGDYHVGEQADPRSRAEALSRGVELTSLARQFQVRDYDVFDYVLAMDRKNQLNLARIARSDADLGKLHLLREFDRDANGELDVPDPYYGGDDGFAHVFEICLRSCEGLLAQIRRERGL